MHFMISNSHFLIFMSLISLFISYLSCALIKYNSEFLIKISSHAVLYHFRLLLSPIIASNQSIDNNQLIAASSLLFLLSRTLSSSFFVMNNNFLIDSLMCTISINFCMQYVLHNSAYFIFPYRLRVHSY